MKRIFCITISILLTLSTVGCNSREAIKAPVETRFERYIEPYCKNNGFSGSILISDKGNVVFKKGYGMADYEKSVPNETGTQFRIASITKQFTAMCIMILQEKGLVDVNDKVDRFIPDYPNGCEISIHDLLAMSSGITNDIPGILPQYDFASGTYTNHGKPTRKDEYFTPSDMINLFKNKPLNFKPGEKFKYSNSNYIILGYIIEKISNMSYEDFVKKNIFIPLDMKNSGYENNKVHPSVAVGYDKLSPEPVRTISYNMSIFFSCGGLYSTVEDLYKWDQALYTERLVKSETMAKVFKPYTRMKDYPYHSYGYGWVVNELSKKPQVEHDGTLPGYCSFIIHAEDTKRTIIVLCNNTDFTPRIHDFCTGFFSILNGLQ